MSEKAEEKVEVTEGVSEGHMADSLKDAHYLIQVELINPAAYGLYKRGYLRVNAAQKPEVKDGELHIRGSGMPDYAVPMGNIAYRKIVYIWVARFDRDDCTYNAYNYPIDVDYPVGEYVDSTGRIWGTLHEDGHIERYGTE